MSVEGGRAQRPRARCARACDNCKRRKEKCNARQPCTPCIRRRKESQCHFSNLPARVFTSSSSTSVSTNQNLRSDEDNMSSTGNAEMAIDQLLNTSTDTPRNEQEGAAPVPKVARLLRDGQGSYMYLGDSASVSFLESVRRIAAFAIGPCDLAADRLRHSFLETVSTQSVLEPTEKTAGAGATGGGDSLPDYLEAEMLVRQYLLATSGLLELFEPEEFLERLAVWLEDPSRNKDKASAMFYLVLAIGAQALGANDKQILAEKYFARGRQNAFSDFSEVPSLLTAKTYILISKYMLGACRRNGAFMNLGTAVRAAYALGIHRNNANALFSEKEQRDRKNVWKSLRVMDLFLSASLGRPPGTSDFEYGPPGDDSPASELGRAPADERFSVTVVLLCRIFESILTDVYKKQVVSAQVAENISIKFRVWAGNLPPSLHIHSLFAEKPDDTSDLRDVLCASHVIGAYYWSIILLTRPFLIFQVSQHVRRRRDSGNANDGNNRNSEDSRISTFADACVDSALRGLDLAHSLCRFRALPKRLPFIVNSVFNSSLVLGAAFFADYDTTLPLDEGLKKAEEFLALFLPHDPHSCRFAQIVKYLRGAVGDYISHRNRKSMESRSKKVNELFGDVGRSPNSIQAQNPLQAVHSVSEPPTMEYATRVGGAGGQPPHPPRLQQSDNTVVTNAMLSPVSAGGTATAPGAGTWDGMNDPTRTSDVLSSQHPTTMDSDSSNHPGNRISSEMISALTTTGIPLIDTSLGDPLLQDYNTHPQMCRERYADDGNAAVGVDVSCGVNNDLGDSLRGSHDGFNIAGTGDGMLYMMEPLVMGSENWEDFGFSTS